MWSTTQQRARSREDEWTRKHEKHIQSALLLRSQPDLRFQVIEKRYFDALKILKTNYRKSMREVLPEFSNFVEFNRNNYYVTLKASLQMEEAYQIVDMHRFDKSSVGLTIEQSDNTKVEYKLHVQDLSKGQPSLVPGDKVLLSNSNNNTHVINIAEIKDEYVVLDSRNWSASVDAIYDVSFISSGIPFMHCRNALEEYNDNREMAEILFEPLHDHEIQEPLIGVENDELFEDTLNEKQRRAIVGILEARCRPSPYILFGPPGTGKTVTLVAAVKQICQRDPKKRVLVCANSNNCVDQIHAKMKELGVVSTRLRAGQKAAPSTYADLDELINYWHLDYEVQGVALENVVVTTNIMAGKLSAHKFDYVFIDEAGHVNEPEALVPICRLARGGCLVLAGDHKQLGPVVQLNEAEITLGSSIIERMMDNFQAYKKWATTSGYDERYITKLLISYRCDPRILAPSNSLFYDGELECCGKTPVSFLRLLKLENEPLIFLNVSGSEVQPKSSTSFANHREADICVNILMKLLMMGVEPKQVSILTPYKLQKNFIQERRKVAYRQRLEALEDRFAVHETEKERLLRVEEKVREHLESKSKELIPELKRILIAAEMRKSPRQKKESDWTCKIDTVDSFQGDECEVVIISTVRSDPRAGGFIHDRKRINVALSRAKWLVIVVGHRMALNNGSYWPVFLNKATSLNETHPLRF